MYAVSYEVSTGGRVWWRDGFATVELAREWLMENTSAFSWRFWLYNNGRWEECK